MTFLGLEGCLESAGIAPASTWEANEYLRLSCILEYSIPFVLRGSYFLYSEALPSSIQRLAVEI